jgi:hypothetical protein
VCELKDFLELLDIERSDARDVELKELGEFGYTRIGVSIEDKKPLDTISQRLNLPSDNRLIGSIP